MSRDRLPPLSEGEVSPAYLREQVGAEARVILEIGAHHGFHTAVFLKMFSGAMIHAFEPDPRAAARFRTNVSDPRATLHELAVGAQDGRASFHASNGKLPDCTPEEAAHYLKGWDQSGSLHAPKKHKELWPWVKFNRIITVNVRSLDSWAKEHQIGLVDFIWADMQGAEGDLIKGGAATLAQTRYLYAEYSDKEIYEGEPTLLELLDMLPNFSVDRLYAENVLLKNTALAGR
ncbi:MAG: FkbM family methyltransferase [Planctomycetes bacterium]|nr:FkbM family methyltransferase [Planctomycetota bacterium]